MPRELVLLTPYTPPTQHALTLDAEATAAWLNGWAVLWHPAVLAGAAGPPTWASPYSHDPPLADHVYAIPETPAPYMSGDWDHRVREVTAWVFRASGDRATTLNNARKALEQIAADQSPFDWPNEEVRPFFGLGLAYLTVETLFEAMEHERLLDKDAFWADVQAAARDPKSAIPHLQSAAAKLQSARDNLYPVTIHLLDFAMVEAGRARALPRLRSGSAGASPSHSARSPLNLIATGEALQALGPDRLAELRERAADSTSEPLLEICGGTHFDREDELLPVESQLWNLRRGLEVTKRLTGCDVQTFASPRGSFHPQTPLLLQQVGLTRALFLSFGDAKLPSHKAAVIQWPAADGKQIEAFTRPPLPAGDPNTYFHLAHHLHQTIMQDSAAVLGLLHRPADAAAPWYNDWLAVSELSPVLGTWTTVSRFLGDGVVGEYASPANADEFTIDALEERCTAALASPPSPLVGEAGRGGEGNRAFPHPPASSPTRGEGEKQPVSAFAVHQRLRRRVDAVRTYAALHRALGGRRDAELHDQLAALEERIERFEPVSCTDIGPLETRAAGPLVERLLGRATGNAPGLLLLNPCAFARRVVVERDDFAAIPPIGGPIKAAQRDGNLTRLVVEIPALGFAWLSRTGEPADPRSATRNLKSVRLADQHAVRNESLEAEIDPATGGLRAIRDTRSRENRLGQQLVFQPGSKTIVKETQVTSSGPALGEVVSSGTLVDDQDAVLATFRQRFRTWLGRPLLEMRIELHPERPPQGYPWHAYYGARFAWRDEHATQIRGMFGQGSVTTHTRPTTPDYLELRSGSHGTVILPGGLPFHQRHGSRMLDVILVPPGETTTTFDLALSLDREQPMQTAWGLTSPVLAVPVEKGPPHIGPAGWLFHLDAPNLLMTSLTAEPGEAVAVLARMLELSGYAGIADLRCPRDPKDAGFVDALGLSPQALYPQGDGVRFDYGAHDLITVRVEF
jgi:hypothetical protein